MYAPVTGYDTLYSQTGIEAAENSLLSGNDSALDVRKFIDLITGKTTKGATVEVTINSQAQAAAYNALVALGKPGAVVALNPKTGAILAMATYPSFDPNVLAIHDGNQLIKNDNELLADQTQPLLNRALQGTYPPGSTFKIVTSSALLTAESQHHDQHQRRLADRAHAAADHATCCTNDHGEVCGNGSGQAPLITAFAQSCDTTFGKIGMNLGASALNAMAEKFGMNNPEPDHPAARGAEQLRDTAEPGADRLLGDRPVQRHGHPAAGSHVRRGHRQRRHADEALPGAAGHRQRPEHGPDDPAVRTEPAGLRVRGQRAWDR